MSPERRQSDAPEPAAPRARGRPGRVRRWVVRPLVWLLLLVVLAGVGAYFLAESRFAQERALTFVVSRLREMIDRPIAIGALDYDLYPLRLEIHDLVIPGPEPSDPPVARVERLLIEASLEGLRQPVLTLERVEVDRPRLFIELLPDGTTNLPQLGRQRREEPGRLEVEIGSLAIDGGRLRLEQRELPLSVAARAVRARLVGTGGYDLEGLVTGQEVTVTLPEGDPYAASLSAKLAFRQEEGRLILKTARLRGPDLAADLAGELAWTGGKRLDLEAEVASAAGLLTRVGYLEEEGLLAGEVGFDGKFSWRPESWGFRGEVSSPRLDLASFRLAGITGTVAGDAHGLRLDLAGADYAGGRLQGGVVVELAGEERPVEVDLTFQEVQLSGLIEDAGLPVEGLGGRLRGGARYRFTVGEPLAGSGWADLQLAGGRVGDSRVALAGGVPLVVERGIVSSEAIHLASPDQEVEARGFYDLERRLGRFSFLIESERLGQLASLLPPPEEGEPLPAWLPQSGYGEIAGTLFLNPGGVATDLRLELHDVEAPGAVADRVNGSLRIDSRAVDSLRIELTGEGGRSNLLVRGTIPLPVEEAAAGGAPPPPLDLTIEAEAWPLSDAGAWLPFPLPVTGEATGTVELGGDLESLTGSVSAVVPEARLGDLELGRLAAELRFDPRLLTVEEARLTLPAGEVRGGGTLLRDEAGALDLELSSSRLDLTAEPFASLVPGEISGGLALEAAIAGTLDSPQVEALLVGTDLAVAERPLGDSGTALLRARWDGQEVAAEGSVLGLLALTGGGRLTTEAADLSFAIHSETLAALAELATTGPVPDFQGTMGGTLTVAGSFDGRRPPTVSLRLDQLTLGYEGRSLSALEPVVVRLGAEAVIIETLYLGEPETESEVFAAGRIGLGEEAGLDLRLQSTIDAVWLEPFIPAVEEADGYLDLLAKVEGTLAAPRINGQGEIRDAEVIIQGFPHTLEEVRGTLLFYPRQLVVDSLTAKVAGGTVRAGGSVQLGDGQTPGSPTYRLQLSGQDLNLRYPEGWLVRGDAELSLVSAGEGRELRGVVELERAFYLEDVELGIAQLLQGFMERQRLEVGETDEALASTQLNILVQGPDALRVRNNLADLHGGVDLTVRGSLARPLIFGEVVIAPGGKLVYSDTEYVIERGQLTFANPYRIDPQVDGVATTEIDRYEVTLNLSGTPERLNATFAANPPLPDLDILALVATGRPLAGGGVYTPGAPGGPGAVGAEGFLYGQAASAISERVNTLFRLDKFRIDPLTGESGALSAARVTVGKRLSKDLVVTYSYDPSSARGQLFQAEWQLSSDLALLFTQNGDGSYAVDALWEKRF